MKFILINDESEIGLPKTESLKGEQASKNGNVTKNHRLKNELKVMHFHEDEV